MLVIMEFVVEQIFIFYVAYGQLREQRRNDIRMKQIEGGRPPFGQNQQHTLTR